MAAQQPVNNKGLPLWITVIPTVYLPFRGNCCLDPTPIFVKRSFDNHLSTKVKHFDLLAQ
jgi:hypothetical protein